MTARKLSFKLMADSIDEWYCIAQTRSSARDAAAVMDAVHLQMVFCSCCLCILLFIALLIDSVSCDGSSGRLELMILFMAN